MYVFFFQDQHTLPKWNILWQLLLWFVHMEFPFRTSTPPQNEIFSQSCYCGLFVWSFLSGPAHPLKVKYSLKAVIVACSLCSYSGLSGPVHPPKGKYSLKAVIVACCLCSNILPFQDQHTLPKRNIFSSCYCGLLSFLIYSGLSGPAHPPKEKYSLTAVILACSYGVSCQKQHTLKTLWLVHSAHIQQSSGSSNSLKYFVN